MGQKVNPTGLRIGVIKDWESRWRDKDSANQVKKETRTKISLFKRVRWIAKEAKRSHHYSEMRSLKTGHVGTNFKVPMRV